jgi:hypothetical protein
LDYQKIFPHNAYAEETLTVDGITRYTEKTFRKTIGARWQIHFDDPKYIYYGLPQRAGFLSPKIGPACSMRLVTAGVDMCQNHFRQYHCSQPIQTNWRRTGR